MITVYLNFVAKSTKISVVIYYSIALFINLTSLKREQIPFKGNLFSFVGSQLNKSETKTLIQRPASTKTLAFSTL